MIAMQLDIARAVELISDKTGIRIMFYKSYATYCMQQNEKSLSFFSPNFTSDVPRMSMAKIQFSCSDRNFLGISIKTFQLTVKKLN